MYASLLRQVYEKMPNYFLMFSNVVMPFFQKLTSASVALFLTMLSMVNLLNGRQSDRCAMVTPYLHVNYDNDIEHLHNG